MGLRKKKTKNCSASILFETKPLVCLVGVRKKAKPRRNYEFGLLHYSIIRLSRVEATEAQIKKYQTDNYTLSLRKL